MSKVLLEGLYDSDSPISKLRGVHTEVLGEIIWQKMLASSNYNWQIFPDPRNPAWLWGKKDWRRFVRRGRGQPKTMRLETCEGFLILVISSLKLLIWGKNEEWGWYLCKFEISKMLVWNLNLCAIVVDQQWQSTIICFFVEWEIQHKVVSFKVIRAIPGFFFARK